MYVHAIHHTYNVSVVYVHVGVCMCVWHSQFINLLFFISCLLQSPPPPSPFFLSLLPLIWFLLLRFYYCYFPSGLADQFGLNWKYTSSMKTPVSDGWCHLWVESDGGGVTCGCSSAGGGVICGQSQSRAVVDKAIEVTSVYIMIVSKLSQWDTLRRVFIWWFI